MKTLAIKLEDDVHGQLTAIAQLEDQPVSLLIKQAVEQFIESKRNQPDLTSKAESLLEEIERDAAARREALATLFGQSGAATPKVTDEPEEGSSQRRTRGKGGEPASS